MEIHEIEAMVTITQTGSFTRAAQLLSISQPAISRRIELLEQELGAPLFERYAAGARVTQAGAAFLPYAQQVMAALRDGAAAVQALEDGAPEEITLALVGTLASTQLTGRLQAFRDNFPQARLRLRTARSSEVSDLVLQGEAVLGLRYFADPRAKLLCSVPVSREPLRVVAAAHSRLVEPGTQDVDALRGVCWVSFPSSAGSSGEPFARLLTQQLARHGLEDAPLLIIDSLTAQKRLIEADFGIGLLPLSSVEEEVRLGTLQMLPLPALETSVPVMLMHRRHGYLSAAARHLRDQLASGGQAALCAAGA